VLTAFFVCLFVYMYISPAEILLRRMRYREQILQKTRGQLKNLQELVYNMEFAQIICSQGFIILIKGTDVHRLHARNSLHCFLSRVVHLKLYLRLCLKVSVNKNYILF
jgi:hypothetical protein